MNMQQMMKQAQKMQRQLADAQDRLADIPVSASAGGGMVKVEGTADMRITSITIDPDACDPADVELLQDSLLAAVNECLSSAQDAANQQLGSVTGGMNIPGLFWGGRPHAGWHDKRRQGSAAPARRAGQVAGHRPQVGPAHSLLAARGGRRGGP